MAFAKNAHLRTIKKLNKRIINGLAIGYLIALISFLYLITTYIDITKVGNFSYIKELCETLLIHKSNNGISFAFAFILGSIVWVLFLGVSTPIALIAGFLYGPYLGTILSMIGSTFGCTLLYIIAKFFFKDPITKYLSPKISKFQEKFKKNELLYFLIFRFCGGGGIPFPIQNILPVVINMKVKNYFIASFIGFIPIIFVINSIGHAINSIILDTTKITFLSMIKQPEVYHPIMLFFVVITASLLIRKKYL